MAHSVPAVADIHKVYCEATTSEHLSSGDVQQRPKAFHLGFEYIKNTFVRVKMKSFLSIISRKCSNLFWDFGPM